LIDLKSVPFSIKRKPLGSLKELGRWLLAAIVNSWLPFFGKMMAEEILDFPPERFYGK